MCGIVGYVGENSASPILIDGLKKLEYRGYDSAGIAVSENGKTDVVKTKGRIKNLEEKLEEVGGLSGTVGIGHTRWATHGAPTDVNAHPHKGGNGRITLVHNGIIENYIELKTMLQKGGYVFVSETDTEVLAHLFDYYYKGDLLDAMVNVMKTVRGSYAVAILADDKPGTIIAARKDSPLIVGLGDGENFLASDIPAVLKYTRDCYLLEDNQIAVLTKDNVTLYDTDKNVVKKDVYHVTWDVEAAEKCGYEHFMQKEIAEQPKAIHDTLSPRIKDGRVSIPELTLTDEEIKNIGKIHIVACGSAWHVGMTAAFNAPLAGTMFVLEEIHHTFDKSLLCMGIVSSITADYISKLFFGQNTVFNYDTVNFPLKYYWLLIIMGFFLGLCGCAYNVCMGKAQDLYKKIKIPNYIKLPIIFVFSGVVGLVMPQILCDKISGCIAY